MDRIHIDAYRGPGQTPERTVVQFRTDTLDPEYRAFLWHRGIQETMDIVHKLMKDPEVKAVNLMKIDSMTTEMD